MRLNCRLTMAQYLIHIPEYSSNVPPSQLWLQRQTQKHRSMVVKIIYKKAISMLRPGALLY